MMTHHSHKHEHYPLITSLLIAFVSVLLAGLGLNAGICYYRDRINVADDPTEWKHFESHGDVELFRRPLLPDSKLFAFRAEGTVDLPMDDIMAVFRNVPDSINWVKDLVEAEELPHPQRRQRVTYKNGKKVEKAILRHRYNVPLPRIKDREFLMKETITTDNKNKVVIAEYVSFEDDAKFPVCDGCVRGDNLGSTWVFKGLNGGDKTRVEADIIVDPHVKSLYPFFVNNFQKRWPVVTVHGLFKVTRHNLGRDDDFQVPNIFHILFPLWR